MSGIIFNQVSQANSHIKKLHSALTLIIKNQNVHTSALADVYSISKNGKLSQGAEARTRVVSQIVSQIKNKIEEDGE